MATVWILKSIMNEEKSADDAVSISIYSTKEKAIASFEGELIIEDHPDRDRLVQELQEGFVDVFDNEAVYFFLIETEVDSGKSI